MSDNKQEKKLDLHSQLEEQVRKLTEQQTATLEDIHTVCSDIAACEQKIFLLREKLDTGLAPLLQRQKEQLALYSTILGLKNGDVSVTGYVHAFSIEWLNTAKELTLLHDEKSVSVRIVEKTGIKCRWPMWRDPGIDLHRDCQTWHSMFLDYYYSIPADDVDCCFYSAENKNEFDSIYSDTTKCIKRPYFFCSQGIICDNDRISEDQTKIHFQKSTGKPAEKVEPVLLHGQEGPTEIRLFEREQIFLLLSPNYPFHPQQ